MISLACIDYLLIQRIKPVPAPYIPGLRAPNAAWVGTPPQLPHRPHKPVGHSELQPRERDDGRVDGTDEAADGRRGGHGLRGVDERLSRTTGNIEKLIPSETLRRVWSQNGVTWLRNLWSQKDDRRRVWSQWLSYITSSFSLCDWEYADVQNVCSKIRGLKTQEKKVGFSFT